MNLKLAISPCPNDTFTFASLITGACKPREIDLEIFYEDIAALNNSSKAGKYDVIKISFANYPSIAKDYQILTVGSALGRGCGPLLIAKEKINLSNGSESLTAIPGANTTANFLLQMALPDWQQKKEFLFSEIESAVQNGQVRAGLIIHENRFTYLNKGLIKLLDLGQWWESETGHPIPLGGIVIKRNLPQEIKQSLKRSIKDSLQRSWNDSSFALPTMEKFAQEMNKEVMMKHVELYVNQSTFELGPEGQSAISYFFQKGFDIGIFKELPRQVFC